MESERRKEEEEEVVASWEASSPPLLYRTYLLSALASHVHPLLLSTPTLVPGQYHLVSTERGPVLGFKISLKTLVSST